MSELSLLQCPWGNTNKNENNMDKCEDSNGKKIIKSAKMDKNGQNKEQLINGARSKTEEPKQETNKLNIG